MKLSFFFQKTFKLTAKIFNNYFMVQPKKDLIIQFWKTFKQYFSKTNKIKRKKRQSCHSKF